MFQIFLGLVVVVIGIAAFLAACEHYKEGRHIKCIEDQIAEEKRIFNVWLLKQYESHLVIDYNEILKEAIRRCLAGPCEVHVEQDGGYIVITFKILGRSDTIRITKSAIKNIP